MLIEPQIDRSRPGLAGPEAPPDAAGALVLETANDAVVEMDRAGRITEFSPAAEKMFGHQRRAVLGRLLADVIVPPGLRLAHRVDFERYLATGEAFVLGKRVELPAQRSDGTTFPVELATVCVNSGGTETFTGFIRDISERKDSERALRDSEERFRLLQENVKEYSIVMLDPQGHVATWHAGAQAFTGYVPSEILGQHFGVFYTQEGRNQGRPENEIRFAKETGRFEDEGWRVRKDGTAFLANVVITSMRDAAGTLVGFAKVTRDLTERRKVEETVTRLHEEENRRMQEANRLKSEFLANMSHELRTPLNAILGFAELMFKGKVGPVAENHKEYLGDILNSARHLLELINGVLDLAKVESGKMEFRPENVDLSRIIAEVRDILRGLASTKRINIEVKVDRSIAAVVLDPSKLRQVLYNYLSNALKFTPDEGLVSIRALPQAGDLVRIEVEDTGIGIRPEDTHRLFVEFQQLDAGMAKKYAGTGLGLALTKRIVEAQGGAVGVDSTVGTGSTFWATLPRHVAGTEVASAAPAHAPPPPALIERTVVVIDDTAAARRLMEAALKTVGCSALCFADPEKALAALEKVTPAMIVLDVLLGDSDGFELLDRVRALPRLQGVPVVVWTVKDLSAAERARLLLSAQKIVPKGQGDLEALLDALEPYLGKRPGDAHAR